MDKLLPKKGRILVSKPTILNDTSFNRSVVLLTEHTINNCVGFIFNKPLEYYLSDLIPEIDCDFTIYQGGPVEQDNLYFVHKVPLLIKDSIKVANGIYWGGNFEDLKSLLQEKVIQANEIRFFLGYAGWENEQLNEEIESDSWFVTENDFPNLFLVDSTAIWKNKLLEQGDDYKLWANAPENIQLN